MKKAVVFLAFFLLLTTMLGCSSGEKQNKDQVIDVKKALATSKDGGDTVNKEDTKQVNDKKGLSSAKKRDQHDNGNWKVDPVFIHPWDEEGSKNEEPIELLGKKGKLAFVDPGPFIAGQPHKIMWLIWRKERDLVPPFEVIGTSKATGEKEKLLYREGLGSPHMGADYHLPTLVELPTPGLWRMDVFINNKLYDSIVVAVQEPPAE